MAENRNLIFSVTAETGDSQKTIAELEKTIRQLIRAFKELQTGSDEQAAVGKQLTAEKLALRDASERLNQILGKENKSLGGVNEAAKFAEGSLGQLRQEQKRLNAEIQRFPIGSKETKAYADELRQVNTKIKDFNQSLKAEEIAAKAAAKAAADAAKETAKLGAAAAKAAADEKTLANAGKEATRVLEKEDATINELTKAFKDLKRAQAGNAINSAEFAEANKQLDALKNKLVDVGAKGSSLTGILNSGFNSLRSQISGVGVGLVGAFALDKLIQYGTELAQIVNEFHKIKIAVGQVSGESGRALTETTARIRAISETFGESNENVLRSANVLAKQYGLTFSESLDLIEKGFVKGANVQHEFLDIIREYPVFFKEAGISAEEFISIATQSQKLGQFSDKGLDLIKEFGLRIRDTEAPKIRAALEGAFGNAFSDDLLKKIDKGELKVTEAFSLLTNKIKETELSTGKLQTLMSDVFGTQAEDIGLQGLLAFGDFKTTLDEISGGVSEVEKQQTDLLKATIDLELAYGALDAELEGTNANFEIMKKEALTEIIKLIAQLIPYLRILGAFLGGALKENIKQATEFLNDVADAFERLRNFDFGGFANIIVDIIKSPVGAIKSILKGGEAAYKQSQQNINQAAEKSGEKIGDAGKKAGKAFGSAIAVGINAGAKEALAAAKKLEDEIKDLRKRAAKAYSELTENQLAQLRTQLNLERKELESQAAFKALTVKEREALILEIEKKYADLSIKLARETNEKQLAQIEKFFNESREVRQSEAEKRLSESEAAEAELNKSLEQQQQVAFERRIKAIKGHGAYAEAKRNEEREKQKKERLDEIDKQTQAEAQAIALRTEFLQKERLLLSKENVTRINLIEAGFDRERQVIIEAYAKLEAQDGKLSAELIAKRERELAESDKRRAEELKKASKTQRDENEKISKSYDDLAKRQEANNKKDIDSQKERNNLTDDQILKLNNLIGAIDDVNAAFGKVSQGIQNVTDAITNSIVQRANAQAEAAQAQIDLSQKTLDEIAGQEEKATGERKLRLHKENEEQKRIQKEQTERLKKAQEDAEAAQREAAQVKKALALVQIAIDTSRAIAEALATPPAPNIPLAALAGALGAAQLAAVASQQFARGGLIKGKSHAEGGIPAFAGGRIINIENDEIILTKGVARNPAKRAIASALNVSEGGVHFARGGVMPGGGQVQIADLLSGSGNADVVSELKGLRMAIENMPPPQVSVEDINKVGAKMTRVQAQNRL